MLRTTASCIYGKTKNSLVILFFFSFFVTRSWQNGRDRNCRKLEDSGAHTQRDTVTNRLILRSNLMGGDVTSVCCLANSGNREMNHKPENILPPPTPPSHPTHSPLPVKDEYVHRHIYLPPAGKSNGCWAPRVKTGPVTSGQYACQQPVNSSFFSSFFFSRDYPAGRQCRHGN